MVSSRLRSLYDANGRFMAERQRQEVAHIAAASRRVMDFAGLPRHCIETLRAKLLTANIPDPEGLAHVTEVIKLDDRVHVASQLGPADFASLHGRGIALAINNRPDGEALFGQPRSARLEKAAAAVGIGYRQIAFSGANVTAEQVRAFRLAVSEAGGPVVAFCKSGFRSALIWAAAAIAEGAEADAVLETAAKAGFDLAKWRADIERLAAEAL